MCFYGFLSTDIFVFIINFIKRNSLTKTKAS